MSDHKPDEVDRNVGPHLEYFAERANLMFSCHFFLIEHRDDKDLDIEAADNPRSLRIQSIYNACLHSSLIALRDLDDFFTLPEDKKNPARPDDLRASSFGLSRSMQFLAEDERKWINKLVAHTTQHGAGKLGYSWDLLELITKAVAQCDSFLEWVKATYSPAHFHTWTAAVGTQSIIRSVMKSIQEETSRQRIEVDENDDDKSSL